MFDGASLLQTEKYVFSPALSQSIRSDLTLRLRVRHSVVRSTSCVYDYLHNFGPRDGPYDSSDDGFRPSFLRAVAG